MSNPMNTDKWSLGQSSSSFPCVLQSHATPGGHRRYAKKYTENHSPGGSGHTNAMSSEYSSDEIEAFTLAWWRINSYHSPHFRVWFVIMTILNDGTIEGPKDEFKRWWCLQHFKRDKCGSGECKEASVLQFPFQIYKILKSYLPSWHL